MGQLSGRKALVTGASRGIGRAIALRLAQDGADVALTFERSADKAEAVAAEIAALGRRSLAIRADSADAAAVAAAVDRSAEALGGLDILVNNAGIYLGGPVGDWTLEDIDRLLAVNVRAPAVAAQAAQAHMSDGGRIISIGSNLAMAAFGSGATLYAMSKSALLGLTAGLARDLGPRGITVNLVHPGSTDSDMNPADGPRSDTQRARTAIGRFGRPEEIAAVVAFLAAPEAQFVTGSSYVADGGALA